MISDRALGAILTIVSIGGLVFYFWWLFLSPSEWKVLGFSVRWLALAVPMFVAVAVVAFIAAWIGWTMLTTPPPVLPEEIPPPEEKKEERKEEEKKA